MGFDYRRQKGVALIPSVTKRFELTGSPVKWLTGGGYSALPTNHKALAWADSMVGVREQGGANKGFDVEAFQYVAGLGRSGGYPWCACFVYWCLIQSGAVQKLLPDKGECAAVRNWVAWAWAKKRATDTPKRGDLFWWLDSRQRGHIGFVLGPPVMGVFRTIEGNTDGEKGSREGDGVYKRFRTVASLKKNKQSGFISMEGL